MRRGREGNFGRDTSEDRREKPTTLLYNAVADSVPEPFENETGEERGVKRRTTKR